MYKKYSLYIDFELPECKAYIKKALEYYEPLSIRKYAETLHNYGTDSIITFSSDGMKNLERAKELFAQLCEKESYYPLNSLAIGHCLQGEYCEAVKIWEKINAQQIEIDFCRFSILNNLFCAYIKSDNLRMANEIKTQLSRSLNISVIPDRFRNGTWPGGGGGEQGQAGGVGAGAGAVLTGSSQAGLWDPSTGRTCCGSILRARAR